MKKYILFLGICLISIFSFNTNVKALNTTCANFVEGNGKYYFIWNEEEIEINENLIGGIEFVEFNLEMSLIQNLNWYIFENSSSGEVMLLLTDYGVYGLDSYTYALRYIQTGALDKHYYRFLFNSSSNVSLSFSSYEGFTNTSYIIKDYGSSRRGRIINTSSGTFNVKTPSDTSQSIEIEESATCNYVPSTVNAPTFESNYTQYNEQNAAVNVTINFIDFDLEKYDYFVSYDEGQTYENINSRVSYYEGKYIVTRLENFNVTAKVVEKETGDFITSSYYEDSIIPVEDYIIFYEDSTKYEYVTIDKTEYLYSKTLRITPKFLVENISYRVSFDGGEIYQHFYDFEEKKLLKNCYALVEVLDGNYKVIDKYYYAITGFEESEKLGEKIIFSEFESETNGERIAYLRILNANSTNNYYVKKENETYKKIEPLTWENGIYYFEPVKEITTYCARITDNNEKFLQEVCYTVQGFSLMENFMSFFNRTSAFIDEQRGIISEYTSVVNYTYNSLPNQIKNILELSYFVLCIIAIIVCARR